MADPRTARRRRRAECRDGPVGVQPTRLRRVEDRTGEAEAGPAVGRLARVQTLDVEAAVPQRLHGTVLVAARTVVDDPGAGQQLGTGLGLELLPQPVGFMQPGQEPRILVAEIEVAGRAVRRAVPVARLELLEERDVDAAAGELPRGCRPHRTAADHDHLGGVAHAAALRATGFSKHCEKASSRYGG